MSEAPRGFPGFSIRHLARTGSTQDVVRRAAVGGADEGFCCVADEQTSGRGRQGRTWSALRGQALLASILVRRRRSVVAGLPFAAGLALSHALGRFGVEASLKWPNDVVIGTRKLAGILCEVEPAASDRNRAAVAVGIGVNLTVSTFPPDVNGISAHEVAAAIEPARLLDSWVEAFAKRLTALEAHGVPGLRDEWYARASGLHREVRAVGPAGMIVGVAEGIDDDGALLIRTESGVARVLAADVHTTSEGG